METQTPLPLPAAQAEPEPDRKWYKKFADGAATLPGFFATVFLSIWSAVPMFSSWIAGCDLKIMATMPSGEILKKGTMGGVMIMVTIIAFMSGTNAGNIFLGPDLAFTVGLVWAMLVLTVDRIMIVMFDNTYAYKKAQGIEVNGSSKLKIAGARILLVLIMSSLTSIAVNLRVFQKEIDGVLAEKRIEYENAVRNEADSLRGIVLMEMDSVNQKVSDSRGEHSEYVATLDGEIDTLEHSIQERQDELQMEIQGRVGSGMKGLGPAAQAIYRNIMADSVRLAEFEAKRAEAIASSVTKSGLDAAEKFATSRLTDLEDRIKTIDGDEKKKLAQIATVVGDGFQERVAALNTLRERSPILMALWMLLFLVIETLPLVLKIWSGNGLYEDALALQLKKSGVEENGKQEIALEALAAKQANERLTAIDARHKAEVAILAAKENHLAAQKAKHESVSTHEIAITEAEARATNGRNAAAMSVLEGKLKQAKALVTEANHLMGLKDKDLTITRAKETLVRSLLDQANRLIAS